jgi:hypothetical protein
MRNFSHSVIAVKVPPPEVSKWLTVGHYAFQPARQIEVGDFESLSLPDPAWRHISRAALFQSDRTSARVYWKEGIVIYDIR